MQLAVYCASSAKIDQAYFEATEMLAKAFARAHVEVIYGGGAIGLMGKLADTMLEEGGRIKGVMPHFMREAEWAHPGIQDFEFTETMHQRKARFLQGVDGLVALPGGTGTLEELLEAITFKRLGKFTQPIVILNTRGYYNPLKQMLEQAVHENFMRPKHLAMWSFVNHPEEVLPAINNAAAWSADAIHFANNS
jgi:uncharacterized protein (TIGR00730 family)